MTNIETALTPISEAQRMLAEAKTLPELRQLRDYATGAKAWAKARGMGISAENEATEVILRAEREIGRAIKGMRDAGLVRGNGEHGAQPAYETTRNGKKVAVSGSFPTKEPLISLPAELGLSSKAVWQFERLAGMSDDRFEAMIQSVRSIEDGRLAKANFYAAIDKADRKRTDAEAAKPTPPNSDFETFRKGAFALLGWEVDEDGEGKPTTNGLLALPNDELTLTATIIKALAVAYNEARNARG